MTVRRGDIVWHDFTHAGGLKKIRPAVVIQNDIANKYSTLTVLAAIREDAQKSLPILVPVPKGVGGMRKDSVIDCGVLSTTIQRELGKPLGSMPPEYMAQVDEALRRSLSL